jgi:hypothetical protein
MVSEQWTSNVYLAVCAGNEFVCGSLYGSCRGVLKCIAIACGDKLIRLQSIWGGARQTLC